MLNDARKPTSTDHPVVVVGAGPAGLVAAVTLATQGIDVLVLDQRTRASDLPRAGETGNIRNGTACHPPEERCSR